MNVVVLGAGALGVYYGSRLRGAGANVTYLVREGRAAQIKDHGLFVTSNRGNDACKDVEYTTDIESIASADLVLIGVKGYHLEAALPQIKHFTNQGAYVLPLLNGIEHITILQDYVGKENVLGGLSFIIATLDGKGHVHHTSDFHRFIFGPLIKEQESFCKELEKVANRANIEAIYSSNILYELWKKYMYITAFSGITTATNEPIGVLHGNDATKHTVRTMLKEMQQLASAYHIELGEIAVNDTMENFLELHAEATSSMHQDRRKGLRLEVDHLHGGAIRLAEDKQMTLPTIETIYGVIAPFEYPRV